MQQCMLLSFFHLLVLSLSCIQLAIAQGFPGEEYSSPQGVCHRFVQNANATGADDGVAQQGYGNNDLGVWRVAVHTNYSEGEIATATSHATENSPDAIARLWLDPYNTTNLNDGSNPYSACGYIFKALPANTLSRGQNDDGSCLTMLSKKCLDALTQQVANSAQWLVANPTFGPFSNLTPPILNPICQQIANDIGQSGPDTSNNFPSECAPYFNNGEPVYPTFNTYTLTDNVTKPTNCSFYDGAFGSDTRVVVDYNSPPGFDFPFNGKNPADAYDELVQTVWPVLTVLMPPANNTRYSSIGGAYAQMSCIRAKNIKAGSRTPPPLPAPTAVHFPGQLSKGAIAGIVVAALIGVAIITGATFWFWKRRRSADPENHQKITDDAELDNSLHKDGQEVYQMDTKGKLIAQLDGRQRAEMGEDPRQELHGETIKVPKPPQELPGSVPVPPKDGTSSANVSD